MNSSSTNHIPTNESKERFPTESKFSQTETFILDIPSESYKKLWFSPSFDYSKICPGFVKSHTLLKGVKRTEGSLERIDYCDGTFIEFMTKKSDPSESETIYEISKTDIPYLKDVEKVT